MTPLSTVLGGVGVAVTRAGSTPGRLGELLRDRGAQVVHWPCIRFDPPDDRAPFDAAVERASEFDWLVVTSPRAARRWLDVWAAVRGPAAPRSVPAAVAGPATAAALRAGGWPVERMGGEYSAAGLLAAFESAGDASGARMLLPSSDLAGDELPDGLRRLGAEVVQVVAYRTVLTPPDPAELRRAAETGTVRVVTFTSPSTVEGFLDGADGATMKLIRDRLAAAAIGPTTAGALEAADWPAVVADVASLEGLVDAVGRAAVRPGVRKGMT
ncbi:MAG TPA: uroporphyrinogen-III synthase [Gemmatimonadota bacterium]|nr:uroporphyrinogen-III synthase [Gemmatimonadota bacterium]